MNQMVDIPMNDIHPLVEVPDVSLYYFLGLAGVTVIGVAAFFFYVLKITRKKRVNIRKIKYKELENIDWGNPKKAAYTISETGRFFANDNERCQKAYENLFERLEAYKYARNVNAIDSETVGYYKLYLEIIDV